eukprot:TRINITY_DN1602_c0_g1_i2.p1 TRINITY_DN1602_c0_g1~~TRINITY_DN1602_c0_g1_i2.p1  ORF type:complete len:183 (+),score=32.14 TRINITY_DN1602_c0_g1_i2:75-623(+)
MSSQKTYIYKDIFTGDEMFGACYPITVEDDVAFCVEAKYIQKGGETFDIGANDEEEGAYDTTKETVLNIVEGHKLVLTSFGKTDFFDYMKKYLLRVKKHLATVDKDRVKPFQQGAQTFIGKIMKNFDEYTFYTGDSMDDTAGLALLFFKDGSNPYFYFFKDGVVLSFPGFGKSLEHPVTRAI